MTRSFWFIVKPMPSLEVISITKQTLTVGLLLFAFSSTPAASEGEQGCMDHCRAQIERQCSDQCEDSRDRGPCREECESAHSTH
jgi:hypothetical protein